MTRYTNGVVNAAPRPAVWRVSRPGGTGSPIQPSLLRHGNGCSPQAGGHHRHHHQQRTLIAKAGGAWWLVWWLV